MFERRLNTKRDMWLNKKIYLIKIQKSWIDWGVFRCKLIRKMNNHRKEMRLCSTKFKIMTIDSECSRINFKRKRTTSPDARHQLVRQWCKYNNLNTSWTTSTMSLAILRIKIINTPVPNNSLWKPMNLNMWQAKRINLNYKSLVFILENVNRTNSR